MTDAEKAAKAICKIEGKKCNIRTLAWTKIKYFEIDNEKLYFHKNDEQRIILKKLIKFLNINYLQNER